MVEIKFQKRLVSYKVWINNILKGTYIKEELQSNYVQINNLKVSRVNLLGIVVLKDVQEKYSSIMLDDGSGKIQVRNFGDNGIFNDISIGDPILLIGKIREFNNERYIIPEIVRKIDDKRWLKVRQLELKSIKSVEDEPEKIVEEKVISNSPTTLIYNIIKELDKGYGAEIDEVLEKSKINEAEKIIDNLLKEGEIFKTSSSRVRVL